MSTSLAYVFDWNPPSQHIAIELTRGNRKVCVHGRNPCYVFCGVERSARWDNGTWVPLAPERRAEWFGTIFGLLFRDREEQEPLFGATERARIEKQ